MRMFKFLARRKFKRKFVDELEFLELHADPREIAELFKKQGVKGYRSETAHCPLSNYLKDALGSPVVATSLYEASALMPERLDRVYFEVGLGKYPVIKEFISQFDDGQFPELEA